ncbi:ABC transporter ATP-binding protein [Priestia endophytica]|jgi:NitT/TauT family transport system ATP-binding protein|uniref:NitT/TauT family transport system ATP-binding protein n=1 Tax=Priestia endophytica DSM 13796 TaxID=1121089 RepID=A0A1I6C5V4_9BACI|nr:ABC transporter ATP-binding protein [Priestia endophytica]KAB2490428.1 ABC transporter ATP-binding protein [Priestia endophytica]KYG30622.1 spermidine/putrescine ABC transporter ATP-binding protein [Priestia endophytica]MBG9815380.1 spermidine/putrescine ABC transporter ATP-binding protein [Priestia endophytica]RAS76492.1 spermidine/putrescine ABC transporter ATP-binding protein [Priestia endophytica]SFQ88547.1 NitT/TauT family transport system ATP-binding protein [Priestia endophytica DSM 
MTFLDVQNISHTYFSKKQATSVLENISFTLEEGEFISLLGPSGCGKTTLLSIISGLLSPTEGSILIQDQKMKDRKDLIGYMLQQDYLFNWKTIKENILLGPKIKKQTSAELEKEATALLETVGLPNVESLYPSELSGGMRQRVSLVRTLITNPQLLLLDEPFSALDFQTKLKLEDLVGETLKNFNKTAVLVTHDIGEAIAMSDRIFLLSRNPGRLSKTFIVPQSLRSLSPLEARQHEEYNTLFQRIWKEFERLEQ